MRVEVELVVFGNLSNVDVRVDALLRSVLVSRWEGNVDLLARIVLVAKIAFKLLYYTS